MIRTDGERELRKSVLSVLLDDNVGVFVFIIIATKQFVLNFSFHVCFLACASVLAAYFSKVMKKT